MSTAPDDREQRADRGPWRQLPSWAPLAVAALVALAVGAAVVLWPADRPVAASAASADKNQFVDAAALAWSATPVSRSDAGTTVHVVAGTPTCIDDWHGGKAGSYTFDVLNDEGDDMEVYLQDTTSKKLYLDVENFGIAATRRVAGVVPPGTYHWVCITSYTIKSSADFAVTGAAPAGTVAGVVPVTPMDLRIPINTYTAWVRGRLPALSAQARTLASDIRTGDLAAAKRDWLVAHTTYETLGAAYGAFGDADAAINGDRTGFRKIESLLCSGAPAAQIRPFADGLVTAIGGLSAQLAKPNSITPLDMGTRPHEILEDTLGKDLNGAGDTVSGTELATVDANITGTFEALAPLQPILAKQDPWLAATQAQLHATQKLVESYHRASGWVPLRALTTHERAALNAHVQEAVELLAHIPPITEPRDNPDQEGGSVGGASSGGNGK